MEEFQRAPSTIRELDLAEMERVAGGLQATTIGVGIGIIGLGVAIAATGGLAAIPIGIIAGAGTAGEMLVAGAAIGAAAGGGALVGTGISAE